MNDFANASGLAGLAADLHEFLAGVRFATPAVLGLLGVLPLLGLVNFWARRRSKAALARVGRPSALVAQLTDPYPKRRWLGTAYPLAWVLLILGVAGPRWGTSDETGTAVGRDLVIVLDLSRSMWADDMNLPPDGWRIPDTRAEQGELRQARQSGDSRRVRQAEERLRSALLEKRSPTRWRAARDAALDLLDGVARRGGHRVAVVIFAARPLLLCPLTTDYDHVRQSLSELDGQFPPAEIRPAPGRPVPSGTRLGAALIAAVAAHDKRFPGYQDIVLLSDGDDPGDDREWVRGSDAARAAGIPVYTVGFGNPDSPTAVNLDDDLVSTQLQELPLQQIAAETRGEYVAARTSLPPLGEFFRSRIEPLPSREVSDESLPVPRERYRWFLAPALFLFAVGWFRGK